MSESVSCTVTLDDQALTELTTLMAQDENKGKSIRIVVAGMGCSGPSYGLTLDDPNPDQTVFEKDGVSLLVEPVLQSEIAAGGGMNINFVDDPNYGRGFTIGLVNPPASSCGGGCSGC